MESKTLALLALGHRSPARLWASLDADTRRLAAEALYDRAHDDREGRLEADAAVAEALRFRLQALRQLPAVKRIQALAQRVRPDDSLSSSLLLALHVRRRRPMLAAFLDALGVEHHDGLIEDMDAFRPPDAAALKAAIEAVAPHYPQAELDVYLASLLALDPDSWGALRDIVR